MDERTRYFTVHPDESRASGSAASSYIPTFGAATTAIDQYRTAGIHSTNLLEIGAAFTDVNAVAALSKIAEGGITSHAELEAAETALQALLLHEIVHVVTYAPKIDYGNGLVSYRRRDEHARTQFGFDLLAVARSRDFLIAPEILRVEDGKIVSATFENNPLVGRAVDTLTGDFDYWNATTADAVNAAVAQHGIPAYLTDPSLVRTRRGDGFAKLFYHRLKISWDEVVGGQPPIVCTFSLPPLLAIVLDRMSNRQDLAQVVSELRDELRQVRGELRELNAVVTNTGSVGDVARRVKYVEESFDAIVTESGLTGAQRFQRRLAVTQGLVRPIVKFMAGFVTKTGPSLEELKGLGPALDLVESKSIVDRTVTAKTFVGLMQTEALQSLVKLHFTTAEIDAIETSISRDQN